MPHIFLTWEYFDLLNRLFRLDNYNLCRWNSGFFVKYKVKNDTAHFREIYAIQFRQVIYRDGKIGGCLENNLT